MKKLTIFFAFSLLLFTSCDKEDDDILFPTNATGEHFKSLVASNNVELIILVETRVGTSDNEEFYNGHSFPGNNYIRVWQEVGNSIYSERNYNLERVVWYHIEERDYNGENTMALLMEIEPY
ncbi:MAG: hypothetical protein SchgKO_10500 [Schleiferiaceae bacterium]